MAYDINYNDERFKAVENEKNQAIANVNNTYGNMVNESNQFYQNQIDASNQYAETQKELQQQNTDFAIEKVEQQKQQAEQDYIKEQKGAYVDYQKQSDTYGVNAEQMASSGLQNTGYAESSQVQMYTAYQNRVAVARESYNRAILNYDNAIKEAQLQNNSALAEIAYKALQTQLELSLQGFQYKNTLLQQQLEMQNQTEDRYYSRWQNVLQQMNTENALAEQVRQYNEQMAMEREQFNWQKQQAELDRQQQDRIINAQYGSGGNDGNGGSDNPKIEQEKTKDSFGNSVSTQSKEDYYFSNKYQPRYVNDQKLEASGLKVYNVFNEGTSSKNASTFGKQNIWTAGGKYYVWDGSIKDYVDVTNKVKTSQEKRVNYEWGR